MPNFRIGKGNGVETDFRALGFEVNVEIAGTSSRTVEVPLVKGANRIEFLSRSYNSTGQFKFSGVTKEWNPAPKLSSEFIHGNNAVRCSLVGDKGHIALDSREPELIDW